MKITPHESLVRANDNRELLKLLGEARLVAAALEYRGVAYRLGVLIDHIKVLGQEEVSQTRHGLTRAAAVEGVTER